jgi:O-antigen/teichoic acid export membrane protein
LSTSTTVFRNTAVLGTARIIQRLSGLAVTLVISRQLGVGALGVYATVVAYYGLVAIAGDAGTTNLVIRELAKDRSRTASYTVHASVLALGGGLLLMSVAWIIVPHLGYSQDLEHALMLVVLALAPAALNTIQEAVFIAHERVEFETITTFFAALVLVSTSVALVKTGHGVISIVVAFVAVEFAVTVVYFVIINRYIARMRFEFDRSTALEIIRDIRAFAGSSLVSGLFARPEILILSLVASTVQVGYYSSALKIVDLFVFVPQVYMTNVYPVLSRSFDTMDGLAQRIQDAATRYVLALACPVCVGIFVAAPQIVGTLYGSRFGPAVPLLRIMALNFGLASLHDVLWRVLAARGEQGRMLRIQLVTTTIRLAGGVALISAFNAKGAAIAVSVSLLLHDLLLARGVRRDGTRVPVLRLSWRFASAAALMGAVVFLLNSAVALWVVVPVAVCVYLVLIVVLRAFSSHEIAAVKTHLQSAFPRPGRAG